MTNLELSAAEHAFIAEAQADGYFMENTKTNGGERGIIWGYKALVKQLHPNSWNPNKTASRVDAAIGESLAEFGQVIATVGRVTEQGLEIIDGEHRSKQLKANDKIVVNVVFGYSEAEVRKLTIILNETRGSADKIELAQLLSEIQEMDDKSFGIGLPYEETELSELLKLAEVDWDGFEEGGDDDFGGDNEGEGGSDDGWTTLVVKVPTEAMDVLNQARALVSDQRDLHKDNAIAWGQVLESISGDFLAQ